MVTFLKRKLQCLLARVPTKLPQGKTAFARWANSIIFMADAPDNDSIRFALAGMIMQGSGTKGYKPKWFFVSQLLKVCSNEVAVSVMNELKTKQQEAFKAAETLKVVPSAPEGSHAKTP